MVELFRNIWTITNPRLWMYVGGPYALGVLIGLSHMRGIYDSHLLPSVAAYFAWFLFFGSSFSVLLNDYYDREIDMMNPKKGKYSAVYEDGNLGLYRFLIALSVAVFIAIALFFPDTKILLFGGLFITLNVLYDVPPFRCKERAFLDLIFGFVCLMPLLAGYSTIAGVWPAPWAVVAGALYFVALELFDKVFDIVPDARAGITTSAVLLGKSSSLGMCVILLLAAAGIVYLETGLLLYTAFIAPYLVYIFIVSSIHSYEDLLVFYGKLFLFNTVWGTLVATYFIAIS